MHPKKVWGSCDSNAQCKRWKQANYRLVLFSKVNFQPFDKLFLTGAAFNLWTVHESHSRVRPLLDQSNCFDIARLGKMNEVINHETVQLKIEKVYFGGLSASNRRKNVTFNFLYFCYDKNLALLLAFVFIFWTSSAIFTRLSWRNQSVRQWFFRRCFTC